MPDFTTEVIEYLKEEIDRVPTADKKFWQLRELIQKGENELKRSEADYYESLAERKKELAF